MAGYTAAHTEYGKARDASAILLLALPPDPEDAPGSPWRLRAVKGDKPSRFQLRTAAFDGPGRLGITSGQDAARSFTLHSGALAAEVVSVRMSHETTTT